MSSGIASVHCARVSVVARMLGVAAIEGEIVDASVCGQVAPVLGARAGVYAVLVGVAAVVDKVVAASLVEHVAAVLYGLSDTKDEVLKNEPWCISRRRRRDRHKKCSTRDRGRCIRIVRRCRCAECKDRGRRGK